MNRVEKWTKDASKGVQVGDTCLLCSGVSVDREKNVYMSESDRHRVVKWSPYTNTSTIVAGKTNTSGSTSALFDHPQGIHVTRDGSAVYVADMWNNRIQKWPKDAREGFTVAGNNTEQFSSICYRGRMNNDRIISCFIILISNNSIINIIFK